MAPDRIWCAVPVYNNAGTVRRVVEGCLEHVAGVVVVDDGSSDAVVGDVLRGLPVITIRHECNLGKGSAIMTAARVVEEKGGEYMITLDADGQHNPDDVPRIAGAIGEAGNVLVVGCRDFSGPNIPGSSRFGRKFANFWMKVETGVEVGDCQSGFRAYPVKHLGTLGVRGKRFDFEAEVITRAAWAGIEIRCVDVGVRYPPQSERISHFKPFIDNVRISLTHARLVVRRLLPVPHRRIVKTDRPDFKALLHPVRLLKSLLREHATPGGLAAAATVGAVLAILPFCLPHTVWILYAASRLNLNKVMAFSIQHFFAPPFVPALCIEVGYFMRNGRWLTEFSVQTFWTEAPARFWEWVLGSFVVAPILAPLAGGIVYIVATVIARRAQKHGGE